jgi:hypothetical protein
MMQVQVRGEASPEEIAAVVAAVTVREPPARPDPLRRWRATRIAALRRPR